MKWSLYLGKIQGIGIKVHWTFLLLMVWIFISEIRSGLGWEQGLLSVAFIVSVFICVVLHELGHALTALRFGCKTKGITLLPIGGVAQMEKIPEKPLQELVMAIAGPLVNIIIATILGIFISLSMHSFHVQDFLAIEHITLEEFIPMLMLVNFSLAIFNFTPAFPMDGGRVLRSLLSIKMGRVKATRWAARIGQVLAVGFVVLGLFYNIWLVIIGIFIFLGAGAESEYEEEKSILEMHQVKDVIMHHFTVLKKRDTIPQAVKLLLDGQEKEFIVLEDDVYCGIMTEREIIKGLNEFGKNGLVGEYMLRKNFILHPSMNLKDAYIKMSAEGIPICPVQENGKIIGVLNLENIMELLMVEKVVKVEKEIPRHHATLSKKLVET